MEEKQEELEKQHSEIRRRRLKPAVKKFFGVLLVFACLGAFFFYQVIYKVKPAFSTATYELGDSVSRNIKDYLVGTEWSVGRGELDISQVDEAHAGTYQALVIHGKREYFFEIVIEDTSPPGITPGENTVYLAAGREYTARDLVEDVTDVDPQVSVYVQRQAQLWETVQFDEEGSFDCIVVAEDSSGNRNAVSVPVVVDAPPEIYGARDIYLAIGSQVDYLENVTAFDRTDGDLTAWISVDDGEVQLDRSGTYSLEYRVEDHQGIETVCSVDVTVAAADSLQEMIGSRQLDRDSDRIIGAANIYDAGVSDHDDIVETLEYMRPALVQLYHSSYSGYSAGSGYIVEITDDTVYICSNRHVVESSDRWDVYFYDGTKLQGTALGCSDSYDVGVVTVALQDVPEELFEQLMTVHIDRKYWDGLNDQRIDVGLERVDREGGILHTSTGTLVKVKQYFAWYDRKDHTEVTLKLEHGDSGSAILDGYGNLIGMAYAYSTSPRRYWCIPLDGILECYEEITGRNVYVY